MKILLATGIYPPEGGGPSTFTKGLAKELQHRGHDVAVLCYGDEKTEQGHLWPVTVITRTGSALGRYSRYLWQACRLARKVDVIFAQGPVSDGLPATIAAFLWRKPLFMKVVGDFAWEIASRVNESESLDEFIKVRHSGKIGWLERLERWTAKRARRVFIPSRYLQGIVTQWGVPAEKSQVIYNTSPILPTPTLSAEEWRAQHQLSGKKILLYVGRLVPWKRLDFALRVLTRLDQTYVFLIAGDGPMRSLWERQAKEYGIADRVRFLGLTSRQEASHCYQAANAFLLPSSYEGLSHVVLEALSVGVPCLVSDAGGNPETAVISPELVRVLPLNEVDAWQKAVYEMVGRHGNAMHWQTPQQMYDAYIGALTKEVSR